MAYSTTEGFRSKRSKACPFDKLTTGIGSSLGSLVAVLSVTLIREIVWGLAMNSQNPSSLYSLKS